MAYEVISKAPSGIAGYGGQGFRRSLGEAKATTACPPFRFTCMGCGLSDIFCANRKKELCDRILGAISLAKNAALRLETKPHSSATVKLFRDVFGQGLTDPWELSGQPGRTIPAGEMVARRFRAVMNELQTSNTIYRCVDANRCKNLNTPGNSRCSNPNNEVGAPTVSRLGLTDPSRNGPIIERPLVETRACHPTETIVVDNVAMALLCKNEVWLCPPFWQLKNLWKESTILHEMFHLCFGLSCAWFQHDQKERKRNSANCYEVFACGGAALADPASVAACTRTSL